MSNSALTASLVKIVGHEDSAKSLGSGDLDVLGTPRLLAWLEEATCAALDLPAGSTSVGAAVELEHLVPSAVGETITVTAAVVDQTPRRVSFSVVATNAAGRDIARGRIRRTVVDAKTFMERVSAGG